MAQARHNLEQARVSQANRLYDWSCFAAQQAGEMGAKAVFYRRNQEAVGHSIKRMLDALGIKDSALLDAARTLDKHYIPTRYPNGFDSGAPKDYYTERDAVEAIRCAEIVLRTCTDLIAGSGQGP
jgi:HEPN domain-containing protein